MEGKNTYKEGVLSAIICNVWWGIMPIYWQWLRPIDSTVIIFYRIFLVAVVSFLVAVWKYGLTESFAPLKNKKIVVRYLVAGIFITVNWSIYIWAVNADYVIQTCIGYYLEPLAICVFGLIIFKEKLNKYKLTAFIFAFVGVAVIIIYYGEFPLLAISLALTFSIYAAIKKNMSFPPILSLLYETIFLAPISLIVIIYMETTGHGALQVGETYKYFLLMFCGLFTAFPLGLFANAVNKINLFLIGLTNYISPTISLIIGIFLFKEPFDWIQLISFAIIWIGLMCFSIGEYKEYNNSICNNLSKEDSCVVNDE